MFKRIKNKIFANKFFSSILKGSLYNIGASIIAIFLGMLFNLLITKYYGVEELGAYSLVNTILSLTMLLALLGTNTALLRLIPEHIVKYSYSSAYLVFIQIFKLVILFSLVSTGILLVSSQYISNVLLHKKNLEMLLNLVSYYIVFNALGIICIATIRALNSIKIYALLQVVIPLGNIIALSLLTYFMYQSYNPIYSLISSYVFVFIIAFILVIFRFKNRMNNSLIINRIANKNILIISLPMFLTTAMSVVIMQIDILMLGSLSTVENVGVYTVVAKIAVLSMFASSAINTIAAPKFSEFFYSEKHQELKNIAQKSTKLQIIISIPIILFLLLAGKFMLSYFGEEFIVGYSALCILIMGYTISSIAGPVEMFLNMTGFQRQLNIIVVSGAFINVILNYILIPIYGIKGAAIATLISIIITKISAMIFIQKKFGYFLISNR